MIVTLEPSADVHIVSAAPTTTHETSTFLLLNHSFVTGYVILVKFDLSSIPATARINNAILSLKVLSNTNAVTRQDVGVWRLVRDWVEDEATWNEAETGTNWGTAGAANSTSDFDPTRLTTMQMLPNADDICTANLTTQVKNWLDGTHTNYGVKIRDINVANYMRWHSSRATSADDRPVLTVDYGIGYQVNSTAITAGVQAQWEPIQTKNGGRGVPSYSDFYRHTWSIAEIDVATYLTLEALKGTALTSLDTTDQSSPNTAANYTTAKCVTVSGRQLGHLMQDVQVEFLVKVI